jgi:hypothetical protein
MTRLVALGAPYTGLPDHYRGTSRDVPGFVEGLPESDPVNALSLRFWDAAEGGPPLTVFEATELARARNAHLGRAEFEVVEIVGPGETPDEGGVLLGYDVAFENGFESLLASILLYDGPAGEREPEVTRLRDGFGSHLNAHGLFETEAEAAAFLRAANELGPWEGPGIEFEIVSVWRIDQTLPGPTRADDNRPAAR